MRSFTACARDAWNWIEINPHGEPDPLIDLTQITEVQVLAQETFWSVQGP